MENNKIQTVMTIIYEYHFAAAAVWWALGLLKVRLLMCRVPEAIDEGVLGLGGIEDEESSFPGT